MIKNITNIYILYIIKECIIRKQNRNIQADEICNFKERHVIR